MTLYGAAVSVRFRRIGRFRQPFLNKRRSDIGADRRKKWNTTLSLRLKTVESERRPVSVQFAVRSFNVIVRSRATISKRNLKRQTQWAVFEIKFSAQEDFQFVSGTTGRVSPYLIFTEASHAST